MLRGLIRLFRRRKAVEFLKPGRCECGHGRSVHVRGKGRCREEFPPDQEWPDGAACACQIYIPDDDDQGGDEDDGKTPSPDELKKLLSL